MGIGENRVWINPKEIDRVETAITRDDLRRLIRQGSIRTRPIKGVSRGRARVLKRKRVKGRRRGPGSREGTAHAKLPRKKLWIRTIRALRWRLKELKENKSITSLAYRKLYRMSRGGSFKNIANLDQHIEAKGLLRKKIR